MIHTDADIITTIITDIVGRSRFLCETFFNIVFFLLNCYINDMVTYIFSIIYKYKTKLFFLFQN